MIRNSCRKGKKTILFALPFIFLLDFNSGVPQGQAFQRAATIIQPKQTNIPTTPWIQNTNTSKINTKNYVDRKQPGPYTSV